MKIFISGGCKNGKSYFAQSLAKATCRGVGGPLYYIATMIPCDEGGQGKDKAAYREQNRLGL